MNNNPNVTATTDFNFNTKKRNPGNGNDFRKVDPFPHQTLGNPEHHRLNLPITRRAAWSPPPRRHALPQHSRFGYDSDFPQQSVLLQGIFFPIRQPQNVLLNTQLMAPPLHRMQYQGLGPNSSLSLGNKPPAGYRGPIHFAPNQFPNFNNFAQQQQQQQKRPIPLEHRRILQNNQPVSRYVN